jgi:hypothetical protein
MLKRPFNFVLGRVPSCDVPRGYASVVPLPAALLKEPFEHQDGERPDRLQPCGIDVVSIK